tara:strand:- start:401 stop:1033 length:633 start_codon:yes stop_codon:yes gene_type:complete
MSSRKEGVMVILSSPSGAGKTTLVKKISKNRNFHVSISYTTRIPRKNETNGIDYYFINSKDFQKLIDNNELLEYAKVFDNYYGTSRKKIIDLVQNGKNVIFDIDWQGTEQIKNQNLNFKLITFFIVPPTKETLLNRLSERENKNYAIIKERMKNFKNDILHWKDYDYVIINDNLEICLKEILNLIDNEILNIKNIIDKSKIEKHINLLIN